MLKKLLYLATLLSISAAWAEGNVHLLFHMGAGANNSFVVGGTVENKSNKQVEKGYVVILPVSERCQPLTFSLQPFGPLAPGEKTQFSVPLNDKFSAYRLAGFAAFDDMGFALPVVDDTHDIISSRKKDQIKSCNLARKGDQV